MQFLPHPFGKGWRGRRAEDLKTYPLKQSLDDLFFVLEDGTGQGRLASVVQCIGVCAVADEHLDQVDMAVVGCQHDLCVISAEEVRMEEERGGGNESPRRVVFRRLPQKRAVEKKTK
jgi:hypothetical protein